MNEHEEIQAWYDAHKKEHEASKERFKKKAESIERKMLEAFRKKIGDRVDLIFTNPDALWEALADEYADCRIAAFLAARRVLGESQQFADRALIMIETDAHLTVQKMAAQTVGSYYFGSHKPYVVEQLARFCEAKSLPEAVRRAAKLALFQVNGVALSPNEEAAILGKEPPFTEEQEALWRRVQAAIDRLENKDQ